MPDAHTRRRILRVGALIAVAAVLVACGEDPQSALDPKGPFAERPDDLFQIVFWVAAVIFVLVQGLILYAVVRYRDRGGDELPRQVHGNTRMEVLWTVVPALILAVIAVPTVDMIFSLDAPVEDSLTIEVVGHRWWWEFTYPAEQLGLQEDVVTANEMAIPTDRPVRLEMTAQDPGGSTEEAVIHSFWVPKLAGKQDVIPGRITTLNMQANEPGRYLGQCAEYCGISHANMRQRVIALEPDDFETWVQQQSRPAQAPQRGTQAYAGMRTFLTSACATCHTVDGVSITQDGQQLTAQGQTGPDLTHLMSRREFAGAILDLYQGGTDEGFTDQPDRENLAAWLRDPEELKPMQADTIGVGMPDLGLTEQQIDDLVAFLTTLGQPPPVPEPADAPPARAAAR